MREKNAKKPAMTDNTRQNEINDRNKNGDADNISSRRKVKSIKLKRKQNARETQMS